jgi:hypothetical protein
VHESMHEMCTSGADSVEGMERDTAKNVAKDAFVDLPASVRDVEVASSNLVAPTRIPPNFAIWASVRGILNFSIGLRFAGERASTFGVGEFQVPLVILFCRRRIHVAIALIGTGGKCSTCDSPLRPK